MIASSPPVAVGLVVAALLSAGLASGAQAFRAPHPRACDASTPSMFAGIGSGRIAASIVAAFFTLLASGWILLAVFVGSLVLFWGRLLHDGRAEDERDRIEGIAKWLEDLRDTLRGSSVGAEEALEHVATRPPAVLEAPMHNFLVRRRQGFRTEAALADLADELAHPTADAAVAAITLVTSGAAGAGRLHATVEALAETARDEVLARERVDRTRAVYQHSMHRLVWIGVLLISYLKLAGGDLLAPYNTPSGQVMLAIPLGLWLGSILWLRSLCRYDQPRGTRLPSEGAGS